MSTNPEPTQKDNGSNDEKPGTSGSFFQRSQRPSADGNIDPLEEGSGDSSPSTFLKVRNASRERPAVEKPKVKRQRISGEGQHHVEDVDDNDDDNDEGIRMDTDSSSSDELHIDENEHLDDMDLEEPDSLPVKKVSSRRSSNAEEGVSTTIPPLSSHIHRSQLSEDQPDSNITRFAVGEAIASTSAAAMAPPLSRLLENSPLADDLYRLSNFESQELGRARAEDEDFTRRRLGRERTPAPGTSDHVENLYFQKDVNENRGPDAFLQKMHGKQRLMWARKLFFLSTELVFPGFKAYSDNRNQMPDYMGVRVRSSCMMQALLYADALFFIMWILSFISTYDILITVLKQLHGYLSICLTCLFIIVNILRLRFGLKGNENDEVQYLALFWMTTVIVQIPLFTFIFLTDLFCPVLMAFTVTMDGAMMVFILLESIVGFIHFRSLLRDELNVIRMARRSKEASQSRGANVPLSSHRLENQPLTLGISKLQQSSRDASSHLEADGDSSSDTESEHVGYASRHHQESMDFRMRIQRLSETQREEPQNVRDDDDEDSNSSEQVTSTSDTIRQRPIRAH